MLPKERADEDRGRADEAATYYLASRTATCNLGVSGQESDGTCSMSFHREANGYIATGGSVMSECGSCSAGGQPFTHSSSPIQLPITLTVYPGHFFYTFAKVTHSCSNFLEHTNCMSS